MCKDGEDREEILWKLLDESCGFVSAYRETVKDGSMAAHSIDTWVKRILRFKAGFQNP